MKLAVCKFEARPPAGVLGCKRGFTYAYRVLKNDDGQPRYEISHKIKNIVIGFCTQDMFKKCFDKLPD